MTPGLPASAYSRNVHFRRPFRMVLQEYRNQQRQQIQEAEQASFNRAMRIEELKDRVQDTLKNAPNELRAAMELQIEASVPNPSFPPNFGKEVETDADLLQQAIEAQAYASAGQYIETLENGSGARFWDFDAILSDAKIILFLPAEPRKFQVQCTHIEGDMIIDGPAAIAFQRYLHFMGIFAVEAAKRACPECGNSEPKTCDTCGGIGWIIPTAVQR